MNARSEEPLTEATLRRIVREEIEGYHARQAQEARRMELPGLIARARAAWMKATWIEGLEAEYRQPLDAWWARHIRGLEAEMESLETPEGGGGGA